MTLGRFRLLAITLTFATSLSAWIQQPATASPTPAKEDAATEKKPVMESPSARLQSARSVLLLRTRGSGLPAEVIRSTMEGWGRFSFVEVPEKADIIVEVATSGESGSIVVSGSSNNSPLTGRPEQSTKTSRDISPATITLTVRDSRNKRVLWTAIETVKSAMGQKGRDNHTVEASEKLAQKFHDRLEPPLTK